MYYLIYDQEVYEYALRSFPQDKQSIWSNDIRKIWQTISSNTTIITTDTIENYLDSRRPTLGVIATFENLPTIEEVVTIFPELFI